MLEDLGKLACELEWCLKCVCHTPDAWDLAGLYKPFSDVCGTTTTEAHRPLLATYWENQNSSFCCQCLACTQCITYDPMWRMWHVAPFVFSTKAVFYCTTGAGNHIGWLHIYMWGTSQWFGTLMWLTVLRPIGETVLLMTICIHGCPEDNIVLVQGCYPQC